MKPPSWFIDLDQVHSSYLLLITLATLALACGALFYLGVLDWVLRGLGLVVGAGIRKGFLLWERLLSWTSWPVFLAIVLGFLFVGWLAGGPFAGLKVFCGLAQLVMGTIACLAYMFIDLERYEVERGYKAVHNPLKGQELAVHVARYGPQVRAPLLIAAIVGMVVGFALLNQGLYETIGKDWFTVEDGKGGPVYVDFLASALINLLSMVNVLELAKSNHFLRAPFVHPARWPASTLLAGFRLFFIFVLLQQFFAALRQGKLLAETIKDFWSPHEPIHERARNALPQYGSSAIAPLLVSLRSVTSLTKEQRDQLPLILATIGPSTIPALIRHLHDTHEHMRAIAIATLGHLHTLETVPLLAVLRQDPSDMVRQSLVETLGVLGSAGTRREGGLDTRRTPDPEASRWWLGRGARRWFGRKKRGAPGPLANPVDLAVAMLESALDDNSAAVRTHAARGVGRIGPRAAPVAPRLIALLKDADETARCQAAEALGQVRSDGPVTVSALVELLQDASSSVKASAARALGALKTAAASAVPLLAPLLQDRDESVRTAAAEAITQVGALNEAAIETLVEGLASPDTVVRAQTAAALGTIGAAAGEATEALVEAMGDDNDRVRGKAAEALGKIGESAAEAAVPGLMRALRDQDNWVSALAAEALGQMGESADGAIPALIRSLGHLNPQVRANAAEALGKMGATAPGARRALEKASRDEDAGARSQAVRALGALGCPTPESAQVVLAGFLDVDPLVRIAAVESVGQWGAPSAVTLNALAPLVGDANDQVKVAAIQVLPRLAGATPAVIDALCRRLLEDDNTWVQVHAALALGKLGPAAVAAGGSLLRAAQTEEVSVREQAMRAIAMIQPPEILQAFTLGLKDANGDIRKVASGGWIRAASIPEAVIPLLVAALGDPEVQVRANAAHALARLDSLPTEAIPLLIACTADPNDALRMNAAMALKVAPTAAADEAMRHLVEDANLRIGLIAAGCLLPVDPGNARARAVVVEALSDPAPRVRRAALELVETLDVGGAAFLEALEQRVGLEVEPELQNVLARLIERLTPEVGANLRPAAEDLVSIPGP
jgi:HEAT repeat protein